MHEALPLHRMCSMFVRATEAGDSSARGSDPYPSLVPSMARPTIRCGGAYASSEPRCTVFDARPPGLHTVKVLMVLLVLIPYRTLPPPRMVRGRCRTPAARSPPEAPSLLLSLGIAPCAISFPVRKAILGCLRSYRDECSPSFFRPLGALIACLRAQAIGCNMRFVVLFAGSVRSSV
jgi:hypothetical protein